MATITFHANSVEAALVDYNGDPTLINHGANSGIGFFGGGFGISVPVNQTQSTSYVTNANGTASGIQLNNTQYDRAAADAAGLPLSGLKINNAASVIPNSGLPNFQAPLNIRFSHDERVRVQNCKLRIFDRNDITKHASGVTTFVYEVRRPNPESNTFDADQGALKHRGVPNEHKWVTFADGTAMADMILTPSPSISGLNTSSDEPLPADNGTYLNWVTKSGEACRDLRHDWYIALSASPDSIGSKTDFGLYFTLEYL